jgi:hypothetical protein
MVMTGCGQVKHLIGGSDTTIKKQDENKNKKSGNNLGNKIVPPEPPPTSTPAPTPSLLAKSPPPSTGGKDENKDENEDAEKSSIGYLAIPLFAVVIAIGGINQQNQQEAREAQEARDQRRVINQREVKKQNAAKLRRVNNMIDDYSDDFEFEIVDDGNKNPPPKLPPSPISSDDEYSI